MNAGRIFEDFSRNPRMHGGTLDVRSTPGDGSEFFFRIPVAPAGVRHERRTHLRGFLSQPAYARRYIGRAQHAGRRQRIPFPDTGGASGSEAMSAGRIFEGFSLSPRMHGGKLDVRSTPDEGSEFFFRIPVAPAGVRR